MPTAILPSGTWKSGSVAPGKCAPIEGDTEGASTFVGPCREFRHTGEIPAGLGGPACGAEDREVAGNAAALLALFAARARHVVGHADGLARDALGAQTLLSLIEVEDVAGVVPVAEEHAGFGRHGARDGVDLLRAGRGEDVAHRRAVSEARADKTGERRVVARATTDDDGDVARGRCADACHPTLDSPNKASVCRDETGG